MSNVEGEMVSQDRVRTAPHMTEAWCWITKINNNYQDWAQSNLDSLCPDQLPIYSQVARVTAPSQDGLQSEGLDREDLHSLGVEVAPVNHLFTWQFALI